MKYITKINNSVWLEEIRKKMNGWCSFDSPIALAVLLLYP